MKKRLVLFFALFFMASVLSAVFAVNMFPGDSENNIAFRKTSSYELYTAHVDSVYNVCGLKAAGLDRKVFERALTGFYNLEADSQLSNDKRLLSVVDFSKKSTEKRLWVIDLKNAKILYHSLVAHGKNTGEQYASNFSNTPSSNQSSLGFYVTGDTYQGKHGLSLYIDGKDQGFNDKARDRAVVVHGADYVSESFIKQVGRLGRSQGCPALPTEIAPEVINTIAKGTVLFLYYPNHTYERSTRFFDLTNAMQVCRKEFGLDENKQLAQKASQAQENYQVTQDGFIVDSLTK